MASKQGSAFITTRKGFCYLTIKIGRRNFNVIRIRNGLLIATEQKTTIFTVTDVQLAGGSDASGCGSNPPRPRTGTCRTG